MRRWSWKVLTAVSAAALATALLGGVAAAGGAKSAVSPPFNQCPQVGASPSCSILIVFGSEGTTIAADPSVRALDADTSGEADDFLVGVQNNSSVAISGVTLAGDNIFKFEVANDGICAHITCTWPAPLGYEGPNTSIEIDDYSNGIVHFTQALAPGATAYFAIEGGNITHAEATPTFGKTAVVDSYSGDVCYFKAGSDKCTPVNAETPIGIGSVLDATKGQAKLNTAEGTTRATGATFKLQELKVKGIHYTVLTLVKTTLAGCKSSGYRSDARHTSGVAAPPKKKKIVSLWAHAKGHFRTQGTFASATTRGTTWVTQELCNGTRIKVLEGALDVRDLVTGKIYRVKAGQFYLAHRPK